MKALNILSNHYDDDELVFNERTGRYELTIQYCKNSYDSTFKNDGELERRIKLNSQVVYNYIALNVATVNKPVVSFLLNRTKEGREFLLDILSAQMYADIQTGYNDLLFQPAINFTGNDKDRREIKKNLLCPASENIFETSEDYFGIHISFQAQFPYQYFMLARKYQ